jgi:hypothetical protein
VVSLNIKIDETTKKFLDNSKVIPDETYDHELKRLLKIEVKK